MKRHMISKFQGITVLLITCLALVCAGFYNQAAGAEQKASGFKFVLTNGSNLTFYFDEMMSGVGSGSRTHDVQQTVWLIRVPDESQTQYLALRRPLSADKTLWEWRKLAIDHIDYQFDMQFLILDVSSKILATWDLKNAWVGSLEAINDMEVAIIIYDSLVRIQ